MVPKARPKIDSRGKRVRTFMPDAYIACGSSYRQQLRSAHRMDPIGKHRAVHLEVVTVIARTKARPAWVGPELWRSGASFPAPVAVGDVDNMAGTVMDAANGVLWVDDCQVTTLWSSKRYAAEGEVAKVVLWVTAL